MGRDPTSSLSYLSCYIPSCLSFRPLQAPDVRYTAKYRPCATLHIHCFPSFLHSHPIPAHREVLIYTKGLISQGTKTHGALGNDKSGSVASLPRIMTFRKSEDPRCLFHSSANTFRYIFWTCLLTILNWLSILTEIRTVPLVNSRAHHIKTPAAYLPLKDNIVVVFVEIFAQPHRPCIMIATHGWLCGQCVWERS